jgi:hypothetical protein
MNDFLKRLGLKAAAATETPAPGQPLTLYQREQRLNRLRTDAGTWLQIPELQIRLAAAADDLAEHLFPRTLCIAHDPDNSSSLVNLRSLLNRLRRTAPPGLHIVLLHSAQLPQSFSHELFGTENAIESGAAALLVDGKVTLYYAGRSNFAAFRDQLAQALSGG